MKLTTLRAAVKCYNGGKGKVTFTVYTSNCSCLDLTSKEDKRNLSVTFNNVKSDDCAMSKSDVYVKGGDLIAIKIEIEGGNCKGTATLF